MDLASIRTKITDLLKKYRYAAIVLLIGLILMVLPTKHSETPTQSAVHQEIQNNVSINEMLAEILSKIEGAGNVQVLLTMEAGEETVYQTDDNISVSENSSTTQTDTVTVTDSERNQTGLIKKINSPTYRGAIVVCSGADSASVRLAIVDAVSKVTGLNSNRISVLKMK